MMLERTKKFWDRSAEKYAKSPIQNMESYRHTLDRTRSYLRPDDVVLEIGAGTGTTAIELAPCVAHITVTDIAPAMIEIGRGKAQAAGVTNVTFETCDSTVPALEGPFDVVLAHNVLHLVEDMAGTLARVHALLKPGGLFISKTFCKPERRGPPIYYAMRIALPAMQLVGKAPFVAFRTAADMERAIADAGFEIIESDNFFPGELRRYIVARSKPADR